MPTENKFTKLSELDQSAEKIRQEIKNKLTEYYHTKENGHIISADEAMSCLGLTTKKQLANLLMTNFRTGSLNVVLEGIELPHKPNKYY